MSFEINKDNSAISMHRGDTGAFSVTLKRTSGEAFGPNDRAIYTIKSGSTTKIEREYALDDETLGNGKFIVGFRNSDTDTWAAGPYTTEIRVAINPIRNEKVTLTIAAAGELTAEVDEETCLAQFTNTSGTLTLTYTTAWSADPATYGITLTGTPTSGDTITIQYDKNADGSIKDGDTIRTITKSKSTLTILDVQKEI